MTTTLLTLRCILSLEIWNLICNLKHSSPNGTNQETPFLSNEQNFNNQRRISVFSTVNLHNHNYGSKMWHQTILFVTQELQHSCWMIWREVSLSPAYFILSIKKTVDMLPINSERRQSGNTDSNYTGRSCSSPLNLLLPMPSNCHHQSSWRA